MSIFIPLLLIHLEFSLVNYYLIDPNCPLDLDTCLLLFTGVVGTAILFIALELYKWL